MTSREWIDAAPAGTMVPVEVVRELLAGAGEIAEGSPGQVAKLLGRSARYWREAAKAGEVAGAYEDDARWRLPLAGCRAHLAKKQGRSRGFHGPRKKTQTAQTARPRSANLSARPQLLSGSPAMGRRAGNGAGSGAPRLADGRGAGTR